MTPNGIVPDALAVGATKPALMRHAGVPVPYFIMCLGVGALATVLTANVLLFAVVSISLIALGRALTAGDHHRPRVLLLGLVSGALTAERRGWGGQTFDPLGVPHRER